MKLTDLNAKFIDSHDGARGFAVELDCPCGNADKDHRLPIPFAVALDGSVREAGQLGWARTGDTIDTLTLSPSVARTFDCKWHGWIRNGEAVTC